jgi:hypothetical protein
MTAPQAFRLADAGRTWQFVFRLVVRHQNVIGRNREQDRGRRLDCLTRALLNHAGPGRTPAGARVPGLDAALHCAGGLQAGSASGSLSAVQQLASVIGSAVVTTVYFSQRIEHGAGHAITAVVAVVAAIAVLGLGLVWLLPKSAPAEEN